MKILLICENSFVIETNIFLFLIKVVVHQGSVLLLFVFATVIDVVIEEVEKGLIYQILYGANLDLMSDSVEDIL